MEKIKDALAKVKLQKKSSVRKKSGAVTATRGAQIAINKDIGHIAYKNTSVVALDNAHLESNRIVSHLSSSPNAGVFDSLRTQIMQKMEENGWQTIAIVSPAPESGKTLVSINLAMSIAHLPHKTAVLVDLDLRRPKVAAYLGIQADKSMNEYLENKAELEDIIVNPTIQRLTVIPTMNSVTRSAEILSSSKINNLLNELKERYESRIIVFDLPPILHSDDAMVLLPQADCILLVVANGTSTQKEIEETLHLLPKDNLLGVVYNKADEERKAYY